MLGDVDSTGLARRAVAASVDELLAGAERREPFRSEDARSGARFERVWVGGEPHVLKYVHVDDDFAIRAMGLPADLVAKVWEAGLMDTVPGAIDHAVAGVATGCGRDGSGVAVLMRDVSAHLVPPGDTPFGEGQHLAFLDHLAALCARLWGWADDVGLAPYPNRWQPFGHAALAREAVLGWPERVPSVAAEGWERFAVRAPSAVAAVVDALRRDVTPFTDALAATPSTFLHGDWKAANLGTAPDGRTILLDWAYMGAGPACHELAWYLALNRAKLPAGHSKQRAIDDFRAALERNGVATAGWWERQLGLCLLGAVVQFGWEKALGDDEELAWWCDQAREGAALL
jgi:hypothetical protein